MFTILGLIVIATGRAVEGWRLHKSGSLMPPKRSPWGFIEKN